MATSASRPSLVNRASLYTRSNYESSAANSIRSRNSSPDASSATSVSDDSDSTPHAIVDPAVIVGMACRLPGAKNPSQLWKNMVEQKDVQREMPKDRFNIDAFYHPNGANKGTSNARYGYFLDDDLSGFDPEFFKISGKEAESMDPQQRLLLEVVYEAMENAGITLEQISGTQTSVFCGCFTNDYRDMVTRDLDYYPKYTVTGTGSAILANRISYFYNLHGPSMTIDTACSSSLIGFHMGHQSIRDNESDISIIVGSALHFDPTIFVSMTDLGFLSTDGRCRAFDANGSGYVRGEGICAVIMKRKAAAEMDGNAIRAIVRGTGSNHDGHKEGITVPNSAAQEELIRTTYKNSGLSPMNTTYFEAHGTGTQAGDPRETRAIGAVFAPNRKNPLVVGSVKTNIGHLEGASGLAGIIKTTLMLEAKKILPNMHFNNPNPNIDFKNWKIVVPTKTLDWEPMNGVRRASINSFGYGGSNAHVILEDVPQVTLNQAKIDHLQPAHAAMVIERPYLLPLTSHTEKAGKLLKKSIADFFDESGETTTADLASSLSNKGRSLHQYRSFVIGKDRSSVLTELTGPGVAWTKSASTEPRVGFIFTGQGAQWFAMGRQLIQQSLFFRQTIERCDHVLQSLPHKPDWSCITELAKSKEESRVNGTAFSSPLCTAVQMGVVDLLREWGIKPSASVGHSAGEIPAAYAAGILSFEDSMACAYYRGYSLAMEIDGGSKVKGAMLAVGMTEAEALTELEAYQGQVVIGAVNSPSSLTLSGDEPAIVELKGIMEKRKIFVRQLQVERAFHSHHIVPYAPILSNLVKDIKPRPATCRMFSSVTARLADASKMGGDYFTANLVGQVRYADALTGILLDENEEQNIDILVEIGPHPALKGPSRQVIQSMKLEIPYVATLARGAADFEALLSCAGQLFALGYPVNMEAVNSDLFIEADSTVCAIPAGHKVALPTYSWDHGKYWSETRLIKNHRLREHRHSILGSQLLGANEKYPIWRSFLRPLELPWLSHHMIEGKIIFPAAGYVSMAIEAAMRLNGFPKTIKQVLLRDVAIKSALVVSEKEMGTEVLLELQPVSTSAKRTSDTWCRFSISSYSENGVRNEHCHGLIAVEEGSAEPIDCGDPSPSLESLRKRSNRCTSLQKYYNSLYAIGLQYGDDFRLLSGNIESGLGFAMAPIILRPSANILTESDRCVAHPTFLDASFHPIFSGIETLLGRPLDEPFVPTFIHSMEVSGEFHSMMKSDTEQRLWVCSQTKLPGPRVAISDIAVRSGDCDQLLLSVKGLEVTALGSGSSEDALGRSLFFRTRWQPAFDHLAGTQQLSEVTNIASLIDIFAHQYPNSKILHVSSNVGTTKEVLLKLGGRQRERRRFQSLTPYSPSSELSDRWADIQQEWAGLIEIGVPKTGEFDVVVLSEPTMVDVNTYLKPQGFVITNGVDFDAKDLSMVFRSPLFTAWRKPVETSFFTDSLTLVLSPIASQETQTLASLITANHKGTVTRMLLNDLATSTPVPNNVVVLSSLDEDLFFDNNEAGASSFEAVQKLLTSADKNIAWLLKGASMESSKPEQAMIIGLARVARNENEKLKFVVLDVGQNTDSNGISQQISKAFENGLAEDEISERHGTLFIPRLEADDDLNSRLPANAQSAPKLQRFGDGPPLALKIGKVGLLETLVFGIDEQIIDNDLADDEVEIEVKASAINFRDVAASIGIIDDYRLGDECSGVVLRTGSKVDSSAFQAGDRVVAWRPGQGAHQSIVRNSASLTFKINNMSWATAAAFTCISITAYYAFFDLTHLQPGETVLIHAAAGGVGQMAIQIAQMIGAKVIASCGSQGKRDLLKSTYGIADECIVSSRDDSFVKDILKLTNGRGVDVALNSLAGDLLHKTWSCMARFGRYVEIGKRDIHENAKIDMDIFRRNVSFASLDLITMFEYNKPLGARMLKECVKLMENGTIKEPQTVLELSFAEAEKGFRLLQMGKHTGKIVLVPHKDDVVRVQPATFRNTMLFSPKKTYLLVGGLGGLGRTLAEWMVRKGVKNLAFFSRSGASRPEAKATVDWLKARDINVLNFTGDVTDMTAVKKCVDAIGDSLAGVFHAAMVLQDAPLNNMTYQQWQSCVEPKVRGAYNLHHATFHLALDFFIPFSSCSAVIGALAQSNYSAANLYLDALMRKRREMGLKGSTINVGMITGVGLVAQNSALEKMMIGMGSDPVNEDELLYQIEVAIESGSAPIVSERGVPQFQTATGINLLGKDYYWCKNSLFRNLYANHDLTGAASSSKTGNSLASMLQTAADLPERTEILISAFIEKIAAVLGVSAESIQASNPLSMYGLDSIVAVEFRKWFSKTINVDIALFEILSSKSISALVAKAAGMMVLDSASIQKEATSLDESGIEGTAGSLEDRSSRTMSNNFTAISRPEKLPMSTFQKRMWFAHRMAEDKSTLNLTVVSRMKGRPHIQAMKEALDELKKRNEMLRTLYYDGDDFPEQKPTLDFDSRLIYKDFSAEHDPEAAMNSFSVSLRNQELDIETGEVMRSALVKLGESQFVFTNIIHHIAIDRGSSKAITEQLMKLYDAIRSQKDLSSVELPKISYIDFAIWYESYLQTEALQLDLQFWRENLLGAPMASKLLPFAKSQRLDYTDHARSVQKMTLGLAMLKRMKRVCSRMGVTPFQFLLAAFRSFLYRYTDEEDLVILAIDGNRPHPDLEDVLGFFVNMIPMRLNEDFTASFDSILAKVKASSLDALAHSKAPFDAIVDAINVKRTPSHFPIGQVVLNYQMHGKMPRFSTQDFEIYQVENHDVPTACEMALEALEDPERGLDLRLEHSTTLYAKDDMERFFDNFLTFMTSLIQDHRQPILEIEMCGPEELDYLSKNCWNTAFTPNTWNNVSVLDKIFRSATADPNAVAIRSTEGQSVSYRQLIDGAQRVAASLQDLGLTPGQSIGVLANQGVEAITAMMGILLARCGYLPMDPDFAIHRLSFMASDSGATVVLVGEGLQEIGQTIVSGIRSLPQLVPISVAMRFRGPFEYLEAAPEDPFYTIYTSGSTGQPKGVVLTQSNTQQMLSTMQNNYSFSPDDKFLHQSSMSFDLSVVQIFSALTCGATICVASSEARNDPSILANFMCKEAVTVTYFTPTQFALLIEYATPVLERCSSYRLAFFAGERLPPRLVTAFNNLNTSATVLNTWSPSELVVQTTIHKVANPLNGEVNIPIGFPLANCRHYIVDANMNPLPATLVGEICVGGAQVGAGYLNRPDANVKSFVEDPFCSEADRECGWTKVFRTGDKGCFLPDGQLQFHGRTAGDKQIKLRGFRIDLGEVEHRIYLEASRLKSRKLVDISVVARAIEGGPHLEDNRQLVAFMVCNSNLSPIEKQAYSTEIHQEIKKYLNAYMLPNGYQFLTELPVTIGGKVDRQDLLSRELRLTFPSKNVLDTITESKSENNPEETALKTIIDILKDVLKLPKEKEVAPTDNFFELGGQSILLLRFQSKLKRVFKTVPSLQELFKAPTPFIIAQKICGVDMVPTQNEWSIKEAKQINWSQEAQLPTTEDYFIPQNISQIRRSDVMEVLITGVDSFIGLHVLADLLTSRPSTVIYVMGSESRLEGADLLKSLQHYKLLNSRVTADLIFSKVRCVPGNLAEPHFGLSNTAFRSLGQSVQSIYHLGGRISLLKNYQELKRLNVDATLDIIKLASCGQFKTEIHYLSTWSVPHLQSHTSTMQVENIDTTESILNSLTPSENTELVYFKSRWVSEMLLAQAARRGFGINVYRASTVTANTITAVAEPDDDFVRRMVLDMIDAGSVPQVGGSNDSLPFVLDFVPVNYLAGALSDISSSEELYQHRNIPQMENMSVYHITNPHPLPLQHLPDVMRGLRKDGKAGSSLPLPEWLDAMKKHYSDNEAAQLRWAAVKGVFESGHVMFALDGTKTANALRIASTATDRCPAVDEAYLRRMM